MRDKTTVSRLAPSAPFYLLAAGAFALLTVSRAAQSGMFLDGVTYASISRNLAAGKGSFWSPFYTTTLYASFHEQPPLGFALQGVAFAIFGDHLAVERAYSILMGSLIALLMALIWRRTVQERDSSWLPVIFWLLPPAVSWSIVNNMLDVTQTVFTSFAVYAFLRSLDRSRAWSIWGTLAGLSVAAAVLSKGPTGFFPLAAPFIAALVMRDRAPAVLASAAAMLFGVIGAALLVLVPDVSRESLQTHWNHQVLASIRGDRGGAGRLSSLWQHLGAPVVLRMSGLALVAWACGRVGQRDIPSSRRPGVWTWFFLVLALAGSLPIMVSARMSGHYFLPSIPFYALGFASLCAPWLGPAIDRWGRSRRITAVVVALGLLFLAGSVVIPLAGRSLEPRDVAWMREYRSVSPSVPRGAILATCEAVRTDWGLHAYMQRLFEVSLDPDRGNERHRYYLQLTDRDCRAPQACTLIATTERMALYDCQPEPR